jgi:NIMA-interacting peptidyl-prolyl cis-trans isomerase 1
MHHRLSISVLLLLAACAHEQKPAPPQAPWLLAKPAAADAAPPEVIAYRQLLTAYRGAEHASSEQTRTQAEALQRARMMSSMAKSGDHLVDLITKYSDRPGAAEDLGLVKLRTATPPAADAAIVKAALALPIGGVSEPIATPEGYVVIERMRDPPPGPERIGARHILISYVGSMKAADTITRSQAEARALAAQVLIEAKKPGADWAALAAQYTDEPGGKKTGGDLGKFGHNQMVPAFEKAAFALSVNQISDVVQSPFGFHIIQRYE